VTENSPEQSAKTHRARKRFGQNFLHNPQIIEKIISSIAPQSSDTIIEIGPGLGALTQYLLKSRCQLTAVELDFDLADHLSKHFPDLNLISQDALKTDFSTLIPSGQKAKIVGNLPYNISTPLIFHLLNFKELCSGMYFMLQKEVVDRMGAETDRKSYGRLSVMVQYHCNVEPLLHIPPSAFNPTPKVDSTFVRLTPREFPLALHKPELLQQVVTSVFSQRRKTMRNGLKNLWGQHLSSIPDSVLSKRPENLSVKEYVELCNLIYQLETQN